MRPRSSALAVLVADAGYGVISRSATEAGHARNLGVGVVANSILEVADERVSPLDQGDRARQGAHIAGPELTQ